MLGPLQQMEKKNREEGTDQESIQSCAIPEHHNIQERQEVNPFPGGDLKAARNRQDSITKINMKYK